MKVLLIRGFEFIIHDDENKEMMPDKMKKKLFDFISKFIITIPDIDVKG